MFRVHYSKYLLTAGSHYIVKLQYNYLQCFQFPQERIVRHNNATNLLCNMYLTQFMQLALCCRHS